MTMQVVQADAVPPQEWRNRGGYTRELLAWPSTIDPLVRISLADINTDGPFSAFVGMQRWFKVIEGAGVELRFADGPKHVSIYHPPLRFDGASAPQCRLLDGRTRDLNLMYRSGSHATMQSIDDEEAWRADSLHCGLFTAVAGAWRCADGRHVELPARSLLWLDPAPAEAMYFKPRRSLPHATAWWLTFSPATR